MVVASLLHTGVSEELLSMYHTISCSESCSHVTTNYHEPGNHFSPSLQLDILRSTVKIVCRATDAIVLVRLNASKKKGHPSFVPFSTVGSWDERCCGVWQLTFAFCSLTFAFCSLTFAFCSLTFAFCSLTFALRQVPTSPLLVLALRVATGRRRSRHRFVLLHDIVVAILRSRSTSFAPARCSSLPFAVHSYSISPSFTANCYSSFYCLSSSLLLIDIPNFKYSTMSKKWSCKVKGG